LTGFAFSSPLIVVSYRWRGREKWRTQLVPRNWNPVVMQGASIMIFEPGIINPAAVLEYECHMVIWNP
jgi:hypothetical protein